MSSVGAGQLHSVKGTAVETIGNLTGSTYLQQAGGDEHAAGEQQVDAAKLKNQGEAVKGKIAGTKDSVVGAVTGDSQQQVSGRCRAPSIDGWDLVSLFPFFRECRKK